MPKTGHDQHFWYYTWRHNLFLSLLDKKHITAPFVIFFWLPSSFQNLGLKVAPPLQQKGGGLILWKPRLIFDNGNKFPFFKRSNSLNCFPEWQASISTGSITISRRFLMTAFKSKYKNGIIGISVWCSFKNGSTIPATQQKNMQIYW